MENDMMIRGFKKTSGTNLELEIFLENGRKTIPLQPAALLHHFLPVIGDVGEINLNSRVKPVLGSHQHVPVLSLQHALSSVLLQLLVEFQADANVDFCPIIFRIGQSEQDE